MSCYLHKGLGHFKFFMCQASELNVSKHGSLPLIEGTAVLSLAWSGRSQSTSIDVMSQHLRDMSRRKACLPALSMPVSVQGGETLHCFCSTLMHKSYAKYWRHTFAQLLQIILMSHISLTYHLEFFKCGFCPPSLLSSFVDFLLDLSSLTYHKPSESLFSHQERVRGERREGTVWWRRNYQCINSHPTSLRIEISGAIIGRWIE